MECAVEELLVALADKLWKGVGRQDLETRVVEAVARSVDKDRWELFIDLDSCFEVIAADGISRLKRTR
jgi:hypothetical protein